MKIKLLLFFTCFLPLCLAAQKFVLKGVLADTAGTALESGTIMLLNPADSSLLNFTRTQQNGAFEFKNLAPGHYLLRGSYLGFRNMQRPVHLEGAAGGDVDLGVLRMETAYTVLGEVRVNAEANPVTIKKDTIEYNAGSFKVKENAVVEDLLKKMPGIEVKQDGTVNAQGEEVKSVLVDGKKFFGDDPKIATKNLPADAVDKVQVFDKKSEQATFSGVDDGVREKTINLDLKEDKKDGWFGRAGAGAGTSNPELRYSGRLNLNRFKPKQQLSFLGLGNNVNEAGFTIDEYMAYSGAMRQMMGGGGGRVRLEFNTDDMSVPLDFGDNHGFLGTWAGGVNFNQEYGTRQKGDLNTSYMYSRADKTYDRQLNRLSLLPESAFNTVQNSHQNTLRDNHRINFTLDQKLDSTNSIHLTSAAAYSKTTNQGYSASETSNGNGFLQNDGVRKSNSVATGTNWTASLLWRHKFAKKGRNFSLALNGGLNNSRSNSTNFSDNGFYDAGGQLRLRDTINQDQTFDNDVLNLGGRANYVEPLGKRRYLEFSYQYNLTDNRADKQVYGLESGERNFNSQLSNAYANRYDYHRAGAGLRINRKDWNGSAGLDGQYAVLDGTVISGQGQPVRRAFRNLLPRADFNYDFSNSKHFHFNYNTGINAPDIGQLQPVPDVSDPLNIVEGNPELTPEYEHNFRSNFFRFSPSTMRSFFSEAAFTYTSDKIVNAQSVDSLFVRRYRPVNVASDYRLFANIGLGFPLKTLKSRINLRSEGSLNRGINYINNTENNTTAHNFNQALNWEFEPAEWFLLFAGATLGWTQTGYSIDKAFDQAYFTQTYTAEVNAELPENFSVNSNLRIVTTAGLSSGYDQTVPVWTAGLSRFFMKNKRIELTFEVHDILNRNVGINRTATLNYVEDERISSLGRYYMLRCTYALNSMGGRQGGPGMRIMIRR